MLYGARMADAETLVGGRKNQHIASTPTHRMIFRLWIMSYFIANKCEIFFSKCANEHAWSFVYGMYGCRNADQVDAGYLFILLKNFCSASAFHNFSHFQVFIRLKNISNLFFSLSLQDSSFFGEWAFDLK